MTVTKCDDCGKDIKDPHEVTHPSDWGVNCGVDGFRITAPIYNGGDVLKFVNVDLCFGCAKERGAAMAPK
jgi:hypothetical protein